jgi:putative SOS response-associated peptidase YedK
MPVAFADPEAWEAWLDPALDGHAAQELLVPLASDAIMVSPANPILNSGRHEGRDCLLVAQAA